jgi:hypothetical protein
MRVDVVGLDRQRQADDENCGCEGKLDEHVTLPAPGGAGAIRASRGRERSHVDSQF